LNIFKPVIILLAQIVCPVSMTHLHKFTLEEFLIFETEVSARFLGNEQTFVVFSL